VRHKWSSQSPRLFKLRRTSFADPIHIRVACSTFGFVSSWVSFCHVRENTPVRGRVRHRAGTDG